MCTVTKSHKSIIFPGDGYFGSKDMSEKEKHVSILVNMSAKVGSIGDNGTVNPNYFNINMKSSIFINNVMLNIYELSIGLGGWYSYRLSKSALNMATKNLSIEWGRGRRKVICLALHPGTVNTDLSRPYHKNVPKDHLFTVEYSVAALMDIIDSATYAKSGKFYSWNGSELPF